MTRETLYAFLHDGGRRGPTRLYRGAAFGPVASELPSCFWEPLDARLSSGAGGGCLSRSRLRAWIDSLPPFKPLARLTDVARLVDDIGHALEPDLALRLFLETLLEDMEAEGAVAVEIARG